MLSIAAVVLSIVVAIPMLSSLITTLPIVRPLLRRARGKKHDELVALFARWSLTVYLTVLVSATFVRDRMLSSFPFAADIAAAAEQSLAGAGGPPAGPVYIVLGFVVFVGLSAISAGIAGCVLGSVALCAAAAGTAVLFAHGNNILTVALIALPPWQWAMFVACVVVFGPASLYGAWRVLRLTDLEPDRTWLTRRAAVAGGLLVLAILFRLFLSSPYLSLVRHWTFV